MASKLDGMEAKRDPRDRRSLHTRRPPRTGRASETAPAAEGGSMATNGSSEGQPERPRPRPRGRPTRLTPLHGAALVGAVRQTGFIKPARRLPVLG